MPDLTPGDLAARDQADADRQHKRQLAADRRIIAALEANLAAEAQQPTTQPVQGDGRSPMAAALIAAVFGGAGIAAILVAVIMVLL